MPQKPPAIGEDVTALMSPTDTLAAREGGVTEGAYNAVKAYQAGGISGLLGKLLEALPAIGGMGYSMAAGGKSTPVGMGMAALGGVTGEAAKQTINAVRGKPLSSLQDQLTSLATQGAVQGGIEGVGRAAVPAARWTAKRLYQSAVKPSVRLRREFPDIVQTALEEGIPAGGGGVGRATRMVSESRQAAMNEVKNAAAAGASPVTANEIVPSLTSAAEVAKLRTLGGRSSEMGAVTERANSIIQNTKGGVPLETAQATKETMQDLATKAYRAEEAGNPVNEIQRIMDENVARAYRIAIEKRAPDVGAINARTQKLIGVMRTLEDAAGRVKNWNFGPSGMRAGIATAIGGTTYMHSQDSKAALTAAVGAYLLGSPGAASRLAIALYRMPQIQQLTRAGMVLGTVLGEEQEQAAQTVQK